MQAIGAVFKDETVLSGMDELNKESWRAVAKYNNLPPPDDDHMELAMGMLPERAIQQTFMWTDDWGETKRWSAELVEAHARMLPEANFTATPGAVDWLTALNEYQGPASCAAAWPGRRSSRCSRRRGSATCSRRSSRLTTAARRRSRPTCSPA